MTFNLGNVVKNHKSLLADILFCFVCALCIAIILCYFIFSYRISTENQKIGALDQKLLVYASSEQKASEQEVLYYKKKVDDFSTLITNHRISLNVFNFIEKNTLPNVWFLSFNVSETKNEINMLGEAQDMETLSNQIRIFEANKDYVSKINILSSQVTQQGKVRFTVSLSLNPKVFEDTAITIEEPNIPPVQ